MRPFASLMDFSQSALFFGLSFQFVILRLPRQSVPRPQFRFLRVSFFLRWQVVGLSACRPTPNTEDQSTVFKPPVWPSYTHRHWVNILVAFYDLHGLQWTVLFPGHHAGHPSNASVISTVKWKGFLFAKKSTDLTWASKTYFCKYWMRNARLPNCLSFCTFLLHTARNCGRRMLK